MIKYLVVFEKTETGYSAYVPDLSGCIATGKTKNMVEKQIIEAIQFHLEGLKEEKIKIPISKTEADTFVFDLK
jgi:predicted RNase H-like HicB family nuclease